MKADSTYKEVLYGDFFSATFHALRVKNKKKFKLLTEDQVSYYFESLMICAIQVILCVSILRSDAIQPRFVYDTDVQLCMFFTNLVLHYGCISIIRNGMQMMRFVTFHSEEFSNPVEAFTLGFLVVCSNVLCEVTNCLNSLSQTTIDKVVAQFVGFKILIMIADFYLKSRTNFPIKAAMGEPLIVDANTAKIFGSKKKKKAKGRASQSQDSDMSESMVSDN